MRALMTIADVSAETGFSASTIRRAIRKIEDDGQFPPPLDGWQLRGRGGYRVTDSALIAWIDALRD